MQHYPGSNRELSAFFEFFIMLLVISRNYAVFMEAVQGLGEP